MTINQRKKGHDFERKISRMLQDDLELKKPVRRILSQYQEKDHPDLKLGRWNLECKAYKKGFEPASAWWAQVVGVTREDEFPALVYKFDNKPIRVRVRVSEVNPNLTDSLKVVDLNWESYCYLLKTMYQDDLRSHFNELRDF
ncbi:MAG: hypothetical protein O3A58_00725 [Proteobacteria bacterium]|nr:hypothetical protein [Pseudomonadota bacterium]